MKAIVVTVMILLVATQAFSKWVLLLEFQLNKAYIASTLCENRTKPVLQCGGKCQLMKKMAEEEKGTSSLPQNGKAKFQEVLFPFEKNNEALAKMSIQAKAVLPHYLLKKYTAPPNSIFHPPAKQ